MCTPYGIEGKFTHQGLSHENIFTCLSVHVFMYVFYLQIYSTTHFVISGNSRARYAWGSMRDPGFSGHEGLKQEVANGGQRSIRGEGSANRSDRRASAVSD